MSLMWYNYIVIVDILNLKSTDVDEVWKAIWPRFDFYRLPGDGYTRWVLLDEVGLSIRHDSSPNFKCCPLMVLTAGTPFTISLLWNPLDIEEGDLISRDFLPEATSSSIYRELRLLGFVSPSRVTHSDVRQLVDSMLTSVREYNISLNRGCVMDLDALQIPFKDGSSTSGSGVVCSHLPQWSGVLQLIKEVREANGAVKLKVYIDSESVHAIQGI